VSLNKNPLSGFSNAQSLAEAKAKLLMQKAHKREQAQEHDIQKRRYALQTE
jgi:hypothetical protein